jgi:hypothetical protein
LSHAGWIANVQRNYDKARGLLEENYSVSKEIGQNQSVAVSLIQLGQFLTMHGSEKENASRSCARRPRRYSRSSPTRS